MKQTVISLLLVLLSLQMAWSQASPAQRLRNAKDREHVFVAAHRADWKYAPENSLQALKNAIFFGADIIETDVRRTSDGHFIMMHDATVNRTTNGTGTISQMTLDEIRTLRLKTNWGQSTQLPVPTLDEFIEEARGHPLL